MKKKTITIEMLVKKRRELWEKKLDISLDEKLRNGPSPLPCIIIPEI